MTSQLVCSAKNLCAHCRRVAENIKALKERILELEELLKREEK